MESIKKKTLGRRKIEIKKIENKTSLQVTFAKRRRGLFRKASELAVLCGVEVAILVQSPSQKMFAFGHPSVGALLDRLSPSQAAAGQLVRRCGDDEGRRKLAEAEMVLEMEKRRAAESGGGCGGFWWEESVEGLELHELEEYLKGLEELEEKVSERLNEFDKVKKMPTPSIQDFCNSSPVQDFCNFSSIQDFCASSPVQDFCNFSSIQDFCTSSSVKDFCTSSSVQDFCNSSSVQDFCNSSSVQDFCNSSWIQGLGDDSSANPYPLMIETGYGLEFLDVQEY